MSRKVVNIKHAKIDRHKPLLSMSSHELTETFHDLGADNFEGMLEEARTLDQPVRLIGVVLSRDGMPDRFACSYEEYGDEENVDLCEQIAEELTPFLRKEERLRVAAFDVDTSKIVPFKFPSKKMWDRRERGDEGARESWRSYMQLHEARGLVTVIITWLMGPGDRKRVFTWDVDHGDGCGMFEHALNTIEGVVWNKLLGKNEQLKAIPYTVPVEALSELPARSES